MLAAGADKFCWINPGEVLKASGESWAPSEHGAYLYLFKGGAKPVYFKRATPTVAMERA